MDWVACHVLPPDKPTGIHVRGYAVTWLDAAVFGYALAGAIGMFVWTGSWYSFPAVALCMAFAILVWGWK